MESGKEEESLFLAQALLRSAPDYLEARQLARQAAQALFSKRKQKAPAILFIKIKACLVMLQAQLLMRKKDFPKALILLEQLLGELPSFVPAHHLIAKVALKSTPSHCELALQALEEMVSLQPKNISFHLELARAALLSEPSGTAWQPRRAIEAYQHILSINPHHLEARAGLKNAEALFFIKEDGWSSAKTYRDVLR